jgi:hypothetical protein
MAALPSGALLFGGARCTPGCACLGDAWQLRIQAVHSAAALPPAASAAASVEARTIGYEWVLVPPGDAAAQAHAPAAAGEAFSDDTIDRHLRTTMPQLAEEALSPWRTASAWWRAALAPTARPAGGGIAGLALRQVSSPAQGDGLRGATEAPPARYRHSLAAEYRPSAAAVRRVGASAVAMVQRRRAAAGDGTRQADNGAGNANKHLRPVPQPPLHVAVWHHAVRALAQEQRVPAFAVLFGGESYGPSTYYDDAWVFFDAADAAALTRLHRDLSLGGMDAHDALFLGPLGTVRRRLAGIFLIMAAGVLAVCSVRRCRSWVRLRRSRCLGRTSPLRGRDTGQPAPPRRRP